MFRFRKFKHFNLIPIIFVSIVIYKLVDNIETVGYILRKILSLMSYFIWGFVIAYLLNPLMTFIEHRFKTKRAVSILITYCIFLSSIVAFFMLAIPSLIKNIGEILNRLPAFVTEAEKYINETILKNDLFVKYSGNSYFSENINDILNSIRALIEINFTVIFEKLIDFSSILFNLFTGIVISVYLLIEKEGSIAYIKKILFAFLDNSNALQIIKWGNKTNKIFKQFVIGKSIDSLIIGILCFVGLQLLEVKYSFIISIVIGITNLIPYFGNTIGLVPALAITIFSGPTSLLKVTILVISLSLFDGWFLGPKIIGEKVGLSPIWIILAISVGAGIYGIIGMFIAVPLTAVIKAALESYIERKADSKLMSNE
ncbi:AI-2E family transporter [Clostridium thermarum]|uniref:AI-2E family transporter n=1 Tax=Clostridium thermarum TaxID=1716543 RepID=UPI0013D727B7|nr:AI-2E family transporter [Clostridium thermarum]